MSLRIWLPLNDEGLKNKGFDDTVEVLNYGAIINNDGKIGKCCEFDGIDDYMAIRNSSFSYKQKCSELSHTCWIKLKDGYDTNAGMHTISWTNFFVRMSLGKYGVLWAYIYVCDENETDFTNIEMRSSFIPKIETWYHCALTFKNGVVKLYVDGNLVLSKTDLAHPYLYCGRSMAPIVGKYNFNSEYGSGYINDLRMYDNCLSESEIKEISKGLILQYKLNSEIGNSNLLPHTNEGITNWSKSTTGTGVMKIESYLDEETNTNCMRLYDVQKGDWNVLSYYPSKPVLESLKPNTYYTVSFDMKTNVNGKFNWVLSKTDATNKMSAHSGNSYSIGDGNWHHYKLTTKTIVNFDNITIAYQNIYFSGFNVNGGEYIIKNLKMEEGEEDSPWCPNPSDQLYTDLGYNLYTDVVYDCSGLENNGTPTNLTYSNEGRIGNGSVVFDEDKQSSIKSESFGIKTWNISFGGWVYREDWSTPTSDEPIIFYNKISEPKMHFNLVDNRNNVGLQLKAAVFVNEDETNPISVEFHQCGFGNGLTASLSSGWHHVFATSNENELRFFIDGKRVSSTTAKQTYTLSSTNEGVWVGESSTGDYHFNGKLNDIRIYATTLSDDDVKRIYEESARVDNEGNLYCSKLVEYPENNIDDINVNKNGNLSCGTLDEGYSTAKIIDDNSIFETNELYEY